ncbi:MAG: hypothetical protein K5873_06875 [Treponema sp.]|nr:hypothetical protein [Treponema sp.]
MYDANELTNAINRIIEDENHDFTVKVITDLFEEFDMVIYDNQTNTCEIYEIKHSL